MSTAVQLVFTERHCSVDVQVRLNYTVTEESRSGFGRRQIKSTDFQLVRHLEAARTTGQQAASDRDTSRTITICFQTFSRHIERITRQRRPFLRSFHTYCQHHSSIFTSVVSTGHRQHSDADTARPIGGLTASTITRFCDG